MRRLRFATLIVSSGSMPKRLLRIGIDLRIREPEHLVAGLHVGQRQVGRPVRQHRQEPVAQRMTEVEHATAIGGRKPRAVDDVGVVLEEGPHETRVVARVVLEIGVLEDDQVAGRLGDAAAHRRALALIVRLLDQPDAAAALLGTNPRSISRVPSVEQSSTTMTSMLGDAVDFAPRARDAASSRTRYRSL